MRYTIKSRKLNTTFEFSRPGSGNIFVDTTGRNPGTMGQQICSGGDFGGSTLAYEGDDDAEFARICRNWYRAHVRLSGDLY